MFASFWDSELGKFLTHRYRYEPLSSISELHIGDRLVSNCLPLRMFQLVQSSGCQKQLFTRPFRTPTASSKWQVRRALAEARVRRGSAGNERVDCSGRAERDAVFELRTFTSYEGSEGNPRGGLHPE